MGEPVRFVRSERTREDIAAQRRGDLQQQRRGPWQAIGAHWFEILGVLTIVVSLAVIGGYVLASGVAEHSLRVFTAETVSARFGLCGELARITCVVDGDTIWLQGEKIRIADIDTPEVGGAQCPAERELADRATQRLMELLNAGPFVVMRTGTRDTDIYDRKLRVLQRDGESLGAILVAEGLAHEWDGARHPWCE